MTIVVGTSLDPTTAPAAAGERRVEAGRRAARKAVQEGHESVQDVGGAEPGAEVPDAGAPGGRVNRIA